MKTDGTAVTNLAGDGAHPITRRAMRAALELNLITPADLHERGARVQDLSQSNGVALIQCGTDSWVAKHAGGIGTAEGDWRAELAVYRAAPAIGDRKIVPDLLAYSEDHQLMVTEALDKHWLRLDRSDVRSPWSVEIFARVATSLARWHQASQSLTNIEPAAPWLLGTLRGKRIEAFLQRADLSNLLDTVLADAALRSSMEQIYSSWSSSHVMHGDVRLANVMFHTDGSIRLIDWEGSGWGDPRWDLAGLLQELHSAEIQQGVDTSAHRSAVLSAYAERATSPSTLSEDDSTLQAFVAGRLILRAIQLQSWPEGTDDLVNAHLQVARTIRPL